MKKILFGALAAAALVIAAPAHAQTIEDQVAAQLTSSGIDPATATQAQINAALNTVLAGAVEAQLGGSAATGSAADLAAAVKTIIQNNPNLSIGTVAALTSVAIEENPAAAADECVIVDDGDVADEVSNQTGLHEDEILEEAAVASIEDDAVVTDVADVEDDGNFDDEKPAQDSSPT